MTATATITPNTSFLDPAVLARIGNLELLARTVVEGFIQGLHRSPHLGASTDFAEHRAYMPGDDIRRIDWRLWARSDRFYVKEFEADTNTNFRVIVDVSPYAGHDAQFRFRLGTNNANPREGWYVDDIKVQGCGTEVIDDTIFDNGFDP